MVRYNSTSLLPTPTRVAPRWAVGGRAMPQNDSDFVNTYPGTRGQWPVRKTNTKGTLGVISTLDPPVVCVGGLAQRLDR